MSLGKGLTLNLGKRGASVRVGGRGAGITTGTSGTRGTVGGLGTGMSYTKKLDKGGSGEGGNAGSTIAGVFWLIVVLVVLYALIF